MHILESYHRWRAERLERKLKVQDRLIELLRERERAYGSSYYTDRLLDAECKRASLSFQLAKATGGAR